MGKTTTPKYVNVKIVEELADLVDQIVEKRSLGYRSRGEFCHDAIRRLLEHDWEILGTPKTES